MRMTDIIAKKRDGKELNQKEIEFFVKGAADGSIPDYQTSALLMAIYLGGMTENETTHLTLAMAESGDILDLSSLGDKTVDKHSTGGVGDKTTLVCAPIAAALGCTVAKMSGRGLGHTGGTVDKLESITGYKTSLSREEFFDTAKRHGICLMGHSGSFAPADGKLYSLRDVTATVESIPLIASSIMSKKIAAGAKTIVLDVKYGSGAFMKTPEKAEELAKSMVKIGKNAGRNTAAVITDMEIPLGNTIGNALEVKEACEILKGNGDKRLSDLCITLAANMYALSFGVDIETATMAAQKSIEDGSAFKKLCDTVTAQGGDIKLLTGEKEFGKAESILYFKAPISGYISKIDSYLLGKAAGLSGAGRETLESVIDPSAGIVLKKQYGDFAKKDEVIAEVHGKQEKLDGISEFLSQAFAFSAELPPERPLIYKIIT